MNNFIIPEKLGDAKCEVCKHHTLSKVTTIWKFPVVLIINLKRIINTKKDSTPVQLDEQIIIHSSGNKYTYLLTSVVHHHGHSLGSGHYTTKIRKPLGWYTLNDDIMTGPEQLESRSSTAYILIYNLTQ